MCHFYVLLFSFFFCVCSFILCFFLDGCLVCDRCCLGIMKFSHSDVSDLQGLWWFFQHFFKCLFPFLIAVPMVSFFALAGCYQQRTDEFLAEDRVFLALCELLSPFDGWISLDLLKGRSEMRVRVKTLSPCWPQKLFKQDSKSSKKIYIAKKWRIAMDPTHLGQI